MTGIPKKRENTPRIDLPLGSFPHPDREIPRTEALNILYFSLMTGIVGRKIGMAQIFHEDGAMIPVTYILCTPNTVHQKKEADKDGITATVLGFEKLKKEKKTRKYRRLAQFNGSSETKKGDEVTLDIFEEGEKITLVGVSKGKGFTGQVKRHNFSVARETHGTKEARHGSTGACAMPGRTKPGLKMAGRHGNKQLTLRDREVIRIDVSRNIIAVKGPLPGAKDGIILLKKQS